MIKLVNNYEERIKNFVLKIAENPIIINKNNNKHQNSNHPLLIFSSNNFSTRKKFKIKNYTTDKERVNEILHNNTISNRYLNKIEKDKTKQDIIYKRNNKPHLMQPYMRYNARTDLERIYDIIRNQDNFYKQKNKIKKKLEKIEYKSHSMLDDNNEKYDISNENIINNNNSKAFYNNNNEYLRKQKIYKSIKLLNNRRNNTKKKKFLLNLLIESDENNIQNINQRTHFKAMENLKMFKTSTVTHNIFKKIKGKKLERLKINRNSFYETMNSNYLLKNNKDIIDDNINNLNHFSKKNNSFDEFNLDNFNNVNNNNLNYFSCSTINDSFKQNNKNKSINNLINLRNNSFSNNRTKFISINKKDCEDFNIIKEIVNSNSLLDNINYNKINKNNNNHPNLNKEQLNELKRIAFQNHDSLNNYIYDNNNSSELNKNQFDEIKKEQNIFIDGKEYKKTDIDKIATKLLKKCKWDENKVNYNLNDKGGLMFTNGLSIKEFEANYGL